MVSDYTVRSRRRDHWRTDRRGRRIAVMCEHRRARGGAAGSVHWVILVAILVFRGRTQSTRDTTDQEYGVPSRHGPLTSPSMTAAATAKTLAAFESTLR